MGVRHHSPLLPPLIRPPSSLNNHLGEVVEPGRDPFLEFVPEPVREGGGGEGRMSVAIDDLPGLRQDDLGGTLKLGNFTVAGRLSHFREAWSRITIVSSGYALPFTAPSPMA